MKKHFAMPAKVEKRLLAWHEWAQQRPEDTPLSRPCITISREYGCQAYPLAESLQKHLNAQSHEESWTLLDRLLLEKIAEESGYSKSELNYLQQVNPVFQSMIHNFMGREHGQPFDAFHYTRKTIQYFARQGNSIIVGRGGVCLTQDLDNILHIRLVASTEFKLQNIMEDQGLKINEARKLMMKKQGERDQFILHFANIDNTDPTLYHMLINNEKSSIEQMTHTVLARLAIEKQA